MEDWWQLWWCSMGSKGWRNGESAHLPPMWPGFKSWRWRHMWVEFVVGSLLCSARFFSGCPSFPLSSKTNISEFQFDQESGRWRTTLWTCYPQNHYLFYSKKILTNSFIFCYHCHTLFKQQLWTDFLDKTITFNHASAMFGSAQSGKWLRTKLMSGYISNLPKIYLMEKVS